MRNSPRTVMALLIVASFVVGNTLVQAEPTVDTSLDWFAGSWCSADGDKRIVEFWLPAVGGSLQGISRTIDGQRVMSFEFMWIATVDGAPTMHAMPNGGAPTAFARTDGGPQWVRFENAEHDFPNRIDYRREGSRLLAEISGPGRDGADMSIQFDYARCASPVE